MSRFLVYLCPYLTNILQGGMFFITVYRFAEAGSSKLLMTGTMAVWALVYTITAACMTPLLTHQAKPVRLICGASCGLFLTSIGAILFPSLNMQYVWLFTLGVSAGFFTSSFQVFSASLEQGSQGGIKRTTGLYTFAWSSGLATGSFIFGALKHWQHGYMLNAVLAILIALVVLFVNARNKKQTKQAAAEPEKDEYHDFPDLVWVGWTGIFIGGISLSIVRALYPARVVELHFSQFHAGMLLSMVSYVQAFVALLLIFGRKWMYRATPFILFGICGIFGTVLLSQASSLVWLYIASIVYGTYSSSFFFLSCFHSLAKPEKRLRYVPISEVVSAVASIFSPFLGGALAQRYSIAAVFGWCAILLVICIIIQVGLIRSKTIRK